MRFNDVGGTPAPSPGAYETLVRLSRSPRPIANLDDHDLEQLEASVDAAVTRGAAGELSLEETAHVALDGLRAAGVAVPRRAPDDPFHDA